MKLFKKIRFGSNYNKVHFYIKLLNLFHWDVVFPLSILWAKPFRNIFATLNLFHYLWIIKTNSILIYTFRKSFANIFVAAHGKFILNVKE